MSKDIIAAIPIYSFELTVEGFFDPMDEAHTTEVIETYCIDPGEDFDSLDYIDELDGYHEWGRFRIYQTIPYIDLEDELEDKILHRQNIVLASKAANQLQKMYRYLNMHSELVKAAFGE
jgi:hypothetical protein